MAKRSRVHTSDEFGKSPDAPGMVALDALTERESGGTPPPPPVRVRTIVVALIVMFVLGSAMVAINVLRQPRWPVLHFSYSRDGTGTMSGQLDGVGADFMSLTNTSSPTVDGELVPWNVSYDSRTAFLLNGKPLSTYDNGSGPMTVEDMSSVSSSCRVDYVRVPGSQEPRAVTVEFDASAAELQSQFGRP